MNDLWRQIDAMKARGEQERAETKAALEEIMCRGSKWSLSTATRSIVWVARHKILGEVSAPTSTLLLERVREKVASEEVKR